MIPLATRGRSIDVRGVFSNERHRDHPQRNVAALQLFSQSRADELNFPSPGPDLESTLFWIAQDPGTS
jgi:hypothetical protein